MHRVVCSALFCFIAVSAVCIDSEVVKPGTEDAKPSLDKITVNKNEVSAQDLSQQHLRNVTVDSSSSEESAEKMRTTVSNLMRSSARELPQDIAGDVAMRKTREVTTKGNVADIPSAEDSRAVKKNEITASKTTQRERRGVDSSSEEKGKEHRNALKDSSSSSEEAGVSASLGDNTVTTRIHLEKEETDAARGKGISRVLGEKDMDMTIWDRLKYDIGWTDRHIQKYKTFMNNVKRNRLELLREQGINIQNITDAPTRPEYNPELFEGDILLTEQQIDILEDMMARNKTLSNDPKELAIIASNLQSRWPTTIRYSIASGVNTGAIEAGIRKWQELTCLQFIRDDKYTGDRMYIFNGGGCYSSVGRVGGQQKVSLGPGCEMLGTVCHEIAHALGVWHEQSRNDRDNYISVNFNNIVTSAKGNFEKLASNYMFHQEIPYDYASQMHYGSKAFAVNYQNYAITTRKSAFQTTIGQRNYPAFYDAKIMNRAYCRQCSGTCQNGGYVNPKTCSGCICPEGLAGSQCEKAAGTGTNCGTIDLDVSGGARTVTQSGSGMCYWVVKSRPGTRVQVSFPAFDMACESEVCTQAYFGMSLETTIGHGLARICCRPGSPLVASMNVVVLKYYSTRSSKLTFTAQQV